MSKQLIAALLASAIVAASAPAFAQGAASASKESQQFITKAIEGNLSEIQLGKLAQDKGQSQDVKDFGATLVQDHTDANTKAMDIAKQLNVNAPSEAAKKDQKEYDRLSKLSGDRFDREFSTHMVADHKKDIAEFTKQSKMKSGDPTVSFASDNLPVLQKHLQTAESLEKSEKRSKK